jgi:hypothetical protein
MVTFRGSLILFLTFCLLAAGWSPAYAQSQNSQYFSQTGHNVQGDFLNFYNAASDPTRLYGYPITEQFTDKDGLLVQYFQRARFEYHPELPPGQRVVLTNIGRKLYTPGIQLNIFSPFACRLYSETNYAVCFSFLDFFDKYGGVAQFGYPISPFEYEKGVIIQYFEKARFEWQPSQPEGQRVVITDLGRLYFDAMGDDPGLLQSVPPLNNAPNAAPIINLQVRAFVWKAVTLSNDQQVVYIIAQDQRNTAVSNASCAVIVRWPDGTASSANVTTNSNGIAIAAFNVVNQPYGNLVYIDINCSYNGLVGTTTTSFRIWY